MQSRLLLVTASAAVIVCNAVNASDPLPPAIIGVGSSSNAQKSIFWTPYPATDQYTVWSKTNVAGTFTNDGSGKISGFSWSGSNAAAAKFFKMGATTMSSNSLLTANVFNRLAYGPTPDELERVLTGPSPIGPQGYINEQLAMEGVVETADAYVTVATNGVSTPPWTNWVFVSVTGRATTATRTNLYIYLTSPGEVYIDDVQLTAPTNAVSTDNLIVNGDFEAPLAGTWTAGSIVSGSTVDATVAHSGFNSLHLVSTGAGNGQATALWQGYSTTNIISDGERITLSFW